MAVACTVESVRQVTGARELVSIPSSSAIRCTRVIMLLMRLLLLPFRLITRPFRRRREAAQTDSLERELINVLATAGLLAASCAPNAPQRTLTPLPGARARALVSIAGGPPHFLLITQAGATPGHMGGGGANGFHALIHRENLASAWPGGRVEAKRQFNTRDVGPARRFRWDAGDGPAPTPAMADVLNALGAVNDCVLQQLRDPGVLMLEVAPEPDQDCVRISLYCGNRPIPSAEDITMLRDLCRTFVQHADASVDQDGASGSPESREPS